MKTNLFGASYSLLAVIGLLGILVVRAFALPSDPGDAALDFLEKVRDRKINLEPGGDTAISAEAIEHKKLQIVSRYDRMASDLGSARLQVAAVRQDQDFAGVLVKQVHLSDAEPLQIIPLALVKRGEAWRVAPVPASFENTGARTDPVLKERLRTLENWLLRGQVTELEKLLNEAAGDLKQAIKESIRDTDLAKASPEDVLNRFIDACEKKNLTLMLAFLGGISNELPRDWTLRLKAANRAVAKFSNVTPVWERFISRDTLKVISQVKSGEREQNVTIELLTPALSRQSQPQVTRIQIHLSKTIDDFWRVDLPDEFFINPIKSKASSDIKQSQKLSETFGSEWSKKHPPEPQDCAATLFSRFNNVLNSRSFVEVLRLVNLAEVSKNASQTCLDAAELWSRFMQPTSTIRYSSPIAMTETESSAMGLIQWISLRDPEKLETLPILFEKTAAGWLWTPNPRETSLAPYRDWLKSTATDASENWQNRLFENTPLFDATQASSPPSTAECQKTVQNWLDATESNDVKRALSLCARLDEKKSGVAMLQNMGYEIASAKVWVNQPTVFKIYHGTFGSAVGMHIEQKGGNLSYPFYPIVQTSSGPRIVSEIDLFASDNNGREFLNSAALDRLQNFTSVEIANDYRKLFMAYQADVAIPKP